MQTFEKNVINNWGAKGKTWLSQLPSIIDTLAEYWSLTDIKPVNNMTWNYVALAVKADNSEVVLKISYDKQLILDEYKTLKHFNGHGAIQVLDINPEHHALLLEQAIPGFLLKEHHPKKIEDTIQIYASVIKALATRPLSTQNHYNHMSKWCKAIDRINDPRIESRFIDKARALKLMLLNSVEKEYLCHADLHLENIIQHGKNWVVIDPKGMVGEMAFEAAACDLISKEEITHAKNIASKIAARVTLLADALHLDFNRLLNWIFLRVIISAQWFVEDNGNPDEMLFIANQIYPLLKQEN